MDTSPRKNLENLERTLEIWRKFPANQNLLTLDFKKSKNWF